jgi:flavin reductase (DIM6/NTAB) family NADH-FMN oxidoreductase RutF
MPPLRPIHRVEVAESQAPVGVVNVLAYDQIDLSNKFARTHDNKFAEIDHMIPECGAPVLIGAAAHFECRNEYRHYGGDHIIFIGHVERYAYTNRPTLLFCRGKYMRGSPCSHPEPAEKQDCFPGHAPANRLL